jgi:hypothetical protein
MSEVVKGSVANTVCYIGDATAVMDEPGAPCRTEAASRLR